MALFRSVSSRYGPRRLKRRRSQYKARAMLRPRVRTRDARALNGLALKPPSYYNPGTAITGGFKETMTATLRYSDLIALAPSSVSPVGNIFRLNSLFDPDFTGTGHQPLYFDQISAVYQKYTVLSAKITVTFVPLGHDTDAAAHGPYCVGIIGSNSSTFPASAAAIQEANKSVYTCIARDDGGPSVKTLTLDYIPQRDLGLPASDDTIGADVGSNPAASYFCYVWISDLAGSASTVICQTTIEFKTKFWRQGFTAQS